VNYFTDIAKIFQKFIPALILSNTLFRHESNKNDVIHKLPCKGLTDGNYIFSIRGVAKPIDFSLSSLVFRKIDAIRFGFFDRPDNLTCDSEFFLREL